MKYIDELDLNGKRVLIRCDLDVPIKNGRVLDLHRLESALSTIKFALEAGAKGIIIVGHLGRPEGKFVDELSMRPVADSLSELLGFDVSYLQSCTGHEVRSAASKLSQGQVLLLENVRFYPGEETNDPKFAAELASLCDIYINNAFATSHRKHASCHGIAKHVAEKCAGLTIKREFGIISEILESPERPLVAIFGGSKVSTKIDAICNIAKRADAIIVGGAMANTFLAARGLEVGTSLYEKDYLEKARQTEEELKRLGVKLLLPIDVVIANKLEATASPDTVNADKIPKDKMALDIGESSVRLFVEEAIKTAATIVWNGPMGAFETSGFEKGTFALIDALTKCKAHTIVGGGDTDSALERCHAMDKMYFVSTAGGAFLTLLEGKPLVALEVL